MQTGAVAAYSRGKLSVFDLDQSGSFVLKKSIDLELNDRIDSHLAYVGKSVVFAPANSAIQIYQDDTLKLIEERSPEPNTSIRSIETSLDGTRAAFVFQNKHLWLFEAETNQFVRPSVASKNYVEAASFDAKGNLVYVDNYRKVRRVSDDGSEIESIVCSYTVAQNVCRYIIKPLNSIFPQPGRLSNTMQYFVTGDDTREDYTITFMRVFSLINPFLPMEQLFEGTPRVNLYPWPPVWNGLIFIGLMLFIGCIYIERQQY